MYNATTDNDSGFMLRCLNLAGRGIGYTLSNPLVGCVIVHNGAIIAEGWHKVYGEAHAEVNAINAVADKTLLKECTLYVNLEPCTHHGKTPPCADLIIRHNIKKVVVGCIDPNPLVAGKGIEKMRSAGIDVVTGIEEEACKKMNAVFFTYITQKRPYIILKWAQTADRYMAPDDLNRLTISNSIAHIQAHRLRAAVQAVVVGYNTALHDDPQLDVRFSTGSNPIRVVLDKKRTLPPTLHIFKDTSQKTFVMNTVKYGIEIVGHVMYIPCSENNFEQDVIAQLYTRHIASVIIEGGAATLNAFMAANLWDEAWVFTAHHTLGSGVAAPSVHKQKVEEYSIDDNLFTLYKNA